jgi:hypothetical protein
MTAMQTVNSNQGANLVENWSNIYLQRRAHIIQNVAHWGIYDATESIFHLDSHKDYFTFEFSNQGHNPSFLPILTLSYQEDRGYMDGGGREIDNCCCQWGLNSIQRRGTWGRNALHFHNAIFKHQMGTASLPGHYWSPCNKYSLAICSFEVMKGRYDHCYQPWTLQQHLRFYLRNICYFTPSKIYSGMPKAVIHSIEHGGKLSVITAEHKAFCESKSTRL